MKIKIAKGEAEISKDPFLMLGYGINAYFDIMLSLGLMCICITIFVIPLLSLYSTNSEKGLSLYDKYEIN